MKTFEILTERKKRVAKVKPANPDVFAPQGGPKLTLYDLNKIRLKLKAGEVPASLKRQAESLE